MRYADAIEEGPVELRTPAGGARWVVPYDDYDGISLIADRDALRKRYASHDLRAQDPDTSVCANVDGTLTTLAGAGEIACWGTHQGGGECVAVIALEPFTAEERRENGARGSVEAGILQLTSPLVVAAWHSFTYGADYQHGELEALTVALPLGTYLVTVHRPFAANEEDSPDEHERLPFLIELARVEDGRRAAIESVPGADGWF